jgi:hypothetical protein
MIAAVRESYMRRPIASGSAYLATPVRESSSIDPPLALPPLPRVSTSSTRACSSSVRDRNGAIRKRGRWPTRSRATSMVMV